MRRNKARSDSGATASTVTWVPPSGSPDTRTGFFKGTSRSLVTRLVSSTPRCQCIAHRAPAQGGIAQPAQPDLQGGPQNRQRPTQPRPRHVLQTSRCIWGASAATGRARFRGTLDFPSGANSPAGMDRTVGTDATVFPSRIGCRAITLPCLEFSTVGRFRPATPGTEEGISTATCGEPYRWRMLTCCFGLLWPPRAKRLSS